MLISDLNSAKEQTTRIKQVFEAYADYVSKNPF